MSRVGYVTSPAFQAHDSGRHHPESSARLAAITMALKSEGLDAELEHMSPEPIATELVRAVHAPELVDLLECTRGAPALSLDQDTHVGPESYDAALLASGGLLQACAKVLRGEWSQAFCAARPPGHHAERAQAMGFCLINHVAIVARGLQSQHGLSRVAIVDWDVHHGNGTQHLLEDDPSIFYASLHQSPLFPGTGSASERGTGDGEGATLNLPQRSRATNTDWQRAFEDELLPALESFQPEFVLVSAGFDAHVEDPLAQTCLDEQAYTQMTRGLLDLTSTLGHGRVVSLLEGGYALDALGRSVTEHVRAFVEGV